MKLKVQFYWHTDTEDVDLGTFVLDTLPPVGSLIILSGTPTGHVVWRTTLVYVHPAHPDSPAVRLNHRTEQAGIYMLFVEPAEGPFHGGDAEEPTDA
jgi:hypothetical protein